jgi:hypothetical protein
MPPLIHKFCQHLCLLLKKGKKGKRKRNRNPDFQAQ